MIGAVTILQSWEANAENWIQTIQNEELESRRLVTNEAIIKAVANLSPKKVLDLGCGEGWLSRALRAEGMQVWGCDAIGTLVAEAIAQDGPYYSQSTYAAIAQGAHQLPVPFDAVVINFALLDKEETEQLILSLPQLLTDGGSVIIQTLHPLHIAATDSYQSGWKEGSWNGMKREFVLPYLWYFRTFEDWVALFLKAGFQLEGLSEPVHPDIVKPLSVIFILKAGRHL